MQSKQYIRMNKGGSVARLAILKMNAFSYNEKRPPSAHQSWRDMRYATFKSNDLGLSQGMNDGAPVWMAWEAQFRNETDAHEIEGVRMGHTGWYCDTHQEDLAIGIVAALPHGRWIAGYRQTMNDERVYFPAIFNDAADAARMADEHARIVGEEQTEYVQKWDDAQKLQSENEDAFVRLRECLVLRHKECMSYVRDEIRELCETIRTNRETLATSYKGVL